MRIRNILLSGDVVRFHNHAGIDKQKNSEHQWGCALIVQYIHPECSKELLLAALTHDAAEYVTGDIPFTAKLLNPELKSILDEMERKWEQDNDVNFSISNGEKKILKIADVLEGMFFCIQQVRVGHINAKRPFRKWRKYFYENLIEFAHNYPAAIELYERSIQEMEEL